MKSVILNDEESKNQSSLSSSLLNSDKKVVLKASFTKLKVIQANNLIGYLDGEVIVEINDSISMQSVHEENSIENLLD